MILYLVSSGKYHEHNLVNKVNGDRTQDWSVTLYKKSPTVGVLFVGFRGIRKVGTSL